jgi:Protein of unknown function (DUF3619)
MTPSSRSTDRPALEARLALRLAGSLNAATGSLPPDVNERLRFAREQALARARDARRAASAGSPTTVGVSASGALLLGSFRPLLQRAAAFLPLLLLLAGLMLIQQWQVRERVRAAADIDSLLLVDALPPTAYSDPGFAEYLRSDPQP